MADVWLRVTYRVRSDCVLEFEKILLGEIVPLAEQLGIARPDVWRTMVGAAGEFLELWRFGSVSEYEDKFKALLRHPRVQEIFRRTGPMVSEEHFALLEKLE
jgi:hypothetical protein